MYVALERGWKTPAGSVHVRAGDGVLRRGCGCGWCVEAGLECNRDQRSA